MYKDVGIVMPNKNPMKTLARWQKQNLHRHNRYVHLIVAVCLPNDGLVLGGRRLRVWSRDCVLHSTSELLDGAEQSLNWRYLRLL